MKKISFELKTPQTYFENSAKTKSIQFAGWQVLPAKIKKKTCYINTSSFEKRND